CDPPLEPRSGPGAGSPSRRERLASPRPSGRPTVGWSVPRSRTPRTCSLRRCGSRAHRGVWFRSAAGRPGSRPGSPRGDPAVAVESSLDVAVGWVCAWAWSFPLRRECRKTTIINGRVGEEKPRSKAPILSDRSRVGRFIRPVCGWRRLWVRFGTRSTKLGREKRGFPEEQLNRLAGCIDRGLDAVKPEQEVLRKQVEEIQEIAGTLDPKEGNSAQRQAQFQELIERFVAQGDSFHEHLAKVMSSFQPGLF